MMVGLVVGDVGSDREKRQDGGVEVGVACGLWMGLGSCGVSVCR